MHFICLKTFFFLDRIHILDLNIIKTEILYKKICVLGNKWKYDNAFGGNPGKRKQLKIER